MANMEETSFDPRRRRLCPDGACVGLIGADGRCKICGTAAGGAPPAGGYAESAAPADESDDATFGDGQVDDDAEPAVAAATGGDGFDPKRRLCDDGACIGVIDASGACSVCGKRPG